MWSGIESGMRQPSLPLLARILAAVVFLATTTRRGWPQHVELTGSALVLVFYSSFMVKKARESTAIISVECGM